MEDFNNDIVLSVGILSYNHEKYISQAIESVLMQEVTFKYEVVICDDSSPDNTQTIIEKFKEKYPDLIKTVLRTENVGISENISDLRGRCKGKYIIMLEGDDYWIDPKKLQTQYDLLEKHSNYIGIGHWCDIVNEDGEISNDYPNKDKTFNFKKNIYQMKHFKKGIIPGHINTLMYRNIYLNSDYDYEKVYTASALVGDRTTYLILAHLGDIYVIPKIMSHYRYVNRDGATNYISKVRQKNGSLDWYNYYEKLEEFSESVFRKKTSFRKLRYGMFLWSLTALLKNPTFENREKATLIFQKINKLELFLYFPIAIVSKIREKLMVRFSN